MVKKEERPIKLLPDLPSSLEKKLSTRIQHKDTLLGDKERFGESRMTKKSLLLNKLEQYLLKLVIPFLRIAHAPRGRYLLVSFLYFSVKKLSSN